MDATPLHETKIHGTIPFPCSVYHGRIPEWIPSFPLHWHDDFELIYCAKGRMQVTVWGMAYTLCEKDLVVLLPHALHSIEQAGAAAGEYFNILFHPSLLEGSESDLCHEQYVLPFLRGERAMDCFYPAESAFNRTVSPCVLSILGHMRESRSPHELIIKSDLYRLLYFIWRQSTAAAVDSNSLQFSYGRLKNALYYVRRFYDREIPIKEAANQCGFSESHFMKLFKELTGMSFNAYLVNYRLELAAKQLKETDLRVIDIMANCGFRNHSYFTRAFQKKYRMTPRAYRSFVTPLPESAPQWTCAPQSDT